MGRLHSVERVNLSLVKFRAVVLCRYLAIESDRTDCDSMLLFRGRFGHNDMKGGRP